MRVVLNTVYAHLVSGADAKQREEFDRELHGSAAVDAALRDLVRGSD